MKRILFLLVVAPFVLFGQTTTERLQRMGFVNIAEADSSINIELIYTTADNFTGKVLYADLTEAYGHPEAVEALVKAQEYLKDENTDLTLVVYDAARPISVQQYMWTLVEGTSQEIYVSNPKNGGGLHNYGLAMDVTILDKNGKALSMGTAFDHFGEEAHIDKEEALVASGAITEQERKNRLLLRKIMTKAGYRTLNSEWWHFNFRSRAEAIAKYKVIE